VVLLWPSGGGPEVLEPSDPLAFHAFESVARFDFDQSSRTVFTRTDGQRWYVGWEQGGDLRLFAGDLSTGAERWQQRVTGSPQWGAIFPIPGAVIAVGADSSGPTRMHILDAGGGAELWRESVTSDDWVTAHDNTLVWYSGEGGELRGMNIATGDRMWSQQVSDASVAVWMLTDADLALPSDTEGFINAAGNDHRLVVVEEDSSAYTLDVRNGQVISQAQNVADPSEELMAYAGRLYAAADERGFQLLSYDAEDLTSLPQTHYRAGAEQRLDALEPCGPARVCLLEYESATSDTTELVVVDTVEGGELWRQPTADASAVFAVGSWAVVVGRDGPVVGFDQDGNEVLNRPGAAGRVDSGNLLVFTDTLGSTRQDVSAAGVAIEAERPVELGLLPDVIGNQCAWAGVHITCPDQDGATVWRFAEPT
jgi:molecular chaperone HscA